MSKIEVTLIDRMGSDLSVVNAARVSFDKESDWNFWRDDEGIVQTYLKDRDAKLITYLAKHNHWSPFSHAFLSFRIKAPIFVARQLVKHQVGLAWNEVSRRYVDTPPEFYEPETWRQRAENVKQGSADDPVEDLERVRNQITHLHSIAIADYLWLLEKGVCPEQARMILPQSTMTEWIWSGSLYAFARVCKLRLDSHAQVETREVAEFIAEAAHDNFPICWKALMND